MTLQTFLAILGDPIDGPTSDSLYEDTFAVLAHRPSPKNLGFIDRTSSTVSVTVNGHEFAITQSPQLLKSQRAGGTTGAVVWSLTPLLASFLGSPTNPLAVHGLLNPQSTVLELGSGVSSILALSLAVAPSTLRPARVVLSDQEYVLKIASQNLEDNLHQAGPWGKIREDVRPSFISYQVYSSSARKQKGPDLKRPRKPEPKSSPPTSKTVLKSGADAQIQIDLISLDWEKDSLHHHPAFTQDTGPPRISLAIAMDCIYNESLIPHLIQTCIDACTLGVSSDAPASECGNMSDTVVVIALELRSPDVLDYFLEYFTRYFRVWRFPDNLLCKELRTAADDGDEKVGSGYVVYCGILKSLNVDQSKQAIS